MKQIILLQAWIERENEGEEKGFDPKLNLGSIFSVFIVIKKYK